MNRPLISVIMPVYNGELFVREAIDSILSQTYSNFELIIINDGSTDKTDSIIRSYSDPRIRYIINETNLRLIATLNKGLDLAIGDFIARMDADDVAIPSRFADQLVYINKMNCDVVASSYQAIDENGKHIGNKWNFEASTKELNFYFCFSNPLPHPTIFAKASIFKCYRYENNEQSLHVEDTDLWLRMLKNGVQFALDSKKLLLYRRSSTNVTIVHYSESTANQIKQTQLWQQYLLGRNISKTSIQLFLRASISTTEKNSISNALQEIESIYSDRHFADIRSPRLRRWVSYRELVLILSAKAPFTSKVLALIKYPNILIHTFMLKVTRH